MAVAFNNIRHIPIGLLAILPIFAFSEQGGQCVAYAKRIAESILGSDYKSSMVPGLCAHYGFNSNCGARWIYDDWNFGFGNGSIPRKDSLMVLEAFNTNYTCSNETPTGCGHVGVVKTVNVNADGSTALTVDESNWTGNESISYGATYTLNKAGTHVTRGTGTTSYQIRGFVYTRAPEFHGAGSLIYPTQTCFGCNKDIDAVHADGKSGLILFQWYYTTSNCDHIDIAVDGMSYGKPVEIRSGAWDSRGTDKSYLAMLPVSVEANGRNDWNVTAVKLDPFTSPASVTATCKVTTKVGSKTSFRTSNPLGIELENGWIWQGNGSLISTIYGTGFGITQDVVNLNHPKGAAFFQWQKSPNCKNLNITAGVAGNYKIRMRGWDSSPVATASKPLIMSRDAYLSGSNAAVLNYAELANTSLNNYYLLSVYSDTNASSSQINPINVSCSSF